MKALRENMLLQFSVITFVILSIMIFFTAWWMMATMKDMILEEASSQAVDTVSRHISNQLVPDDFQQPMLGERYDAFNDYMQRYIVSDRIARIKLWGPQGQVIFSTDRSQVGRIFPIKEPLARALGGGIGRDISIPQAAENERERILGTLIEVYAPVYRQGSTEVVGVFETYQYFAPFAHSINQANRSLYTSMTIGGIALYLALFLIVRRGWHTILLQRREVDMRLREVTGLNNLFQRHLAERDHIIEALQDLSTKQIVAEALNKEALIAEYNSLKTEVRRLTEEASRSPLADSTES